MVFVFLCRWPAPNKVGLPFVKPCTKRHIVHQAQRQPFEIQDFPSILQPSDHESLESSRTTDSLVFYRFGGYAVLTV